MTNAYTYKLEDINRFVLAKQHLAPGARGGKIPEIVRDITALHATRPSTSYISLHARMKDFRKEDLDRELYEKKTLGKIKCMRQTVHVLDREFLPVAFGATRDLGLKNVTRYCKYQGITEQDYATISGSIMEVLEGKEMNAREIRKEIGGPKETSSIINLMCDQGLIIRGRGKSWKDSTNKYSIFSESFPDVDLDEINEPDAIVSLVRSHLHSHGPVTETDISWWSGIGKTKIRGALKRMDDDICKVRISGIDGEFIMFHEDIGTMMEQREQSEHVVNLLPCQDPYIMGFKDRERYLDEENYFNVFDRSGNGAATILVEGRVEGVWDIEEKPDPMVKIHLFRKCPAGIIKTVRSEADRTGRFICDTNDVLVKECKTMVPLNERTAGGFMTPLRGVES